MTGVQTCALPIFGRDQADFDVELIPLAERRRGRYGTASVAFMIRTNPDLEYGPLEKVASGGELSRISLAIQVDRKTSCRGRV